MKKLLLVVLLMSTAANAQNPLIELSCAGYESRPSSRQLFKLPERGIVINMNTKEVLGYLSGKIYHIDEHMIMWAGPFISELSVPPIYCAQIDRVTGKLLGQACFQNPFDISAPLKIPPVVTDPNYKSPEPFYSLDCIRRARLL